MLYLFAYDDSKTDILKLSSDATTVYANDIPMSSNPMYKNFGKNVTVFTTPYKDFLFGKGVEFAGYNLLFTLKNKPQSPSFFQGVEDIIKPNEFRMKNALATSKDLFIFFADMNTLELYLHYKLFASQFFFNEKNDRFNCSIFQTRNEVYLSEGVNVLTLDVYTFSYGKVVCEGATIEPIQDSGNHIITERLFNDAVPTYPVEIISADTDTYKLTFPSKGEYLIQVTNDNFYPVKTYTKVVVC
jgi:hypothetical protein